MNVRTSFTRTIILGILIIACSGAIYKALQRTSPSAFQLPSSVISKQSQARFETHFASSKLFTQVHAASSIELKNGRIRAFWFSGSREGASDVALHSAVFDPNTSQWGLEREIMTRERTQHALHRYVAKLGNPVVGRQADGSLRMFYVTVSLGGWAGSSITTMTSLDEGETWSEPQRLVTSPFLNISTLVKGAPFLYSDGTLGIPVYHEFISKFAEILHLDQQGVVLDKQRITAGGQGSLQPVLLIQSPLQARVLMRYGGASISHHVGSVSTIDAGQHWSQNKSLSLLNPDAAVSGIVLPDGRLLAALNNLEQGRTTLSLMLSSDDGKSWFEVRRVEDQVVESEHATEMNYSRNLQKLITLSDQTTADHLNEYVESTKRTACNIGTCRYEFSYPYLIQTPRGDFHLVYTWNRTFIKHLWFNQSWLDQQLIQLSHAPLH